MAKDTISPEQSLDNENIFEDFAQDDSLGKEIENHEEESEKDMYYYMKVTSGILKVWNAFFFLAVWVLLLYIYIQGNTLEKRYSIFSPICTVFLGSSYEKIEECYSIGYFLDKSEEDVELLKKQQTKEISSLIGDIYLVDNFIYSKIVSFLISTSKNGLKPTEILSDFDRLKNKYEPIDKSKISCSNIYIREPGILEARCEAFSSDWDTQVVEVKNGILSESESWGTSISIASSFISFIENDPESPFSILEKQKVFFTSTVSGKWIYTKKTPFTLKLRHRGSQSIDF